MEKEYKELCRIIIVFSIDNNEQLAAYKDKVDDVVSSIPEATYQLSIIKSARHPKKEFA